VEHGEFGETFGELVSVEDGKGLVPTFAFIDPFGYTQAKMSLSGKLLEFARSEALFFLSLTDICRFLSKQDQEPGLDSLFGSPRWREAIAMEGRARNDFLTDLFEEQLRAQGQVAHVRSFEIRTAKGRDTRLAFATGHDTGLDAMKNAMWAVDPVEGRRFVAKTESGQEVLLTAERGSLGRRTVMRRPRVVSGLRCGEAHPDRLGYAERHLSSRLSSRCSGSDGTPH
jgi:hypothetical protein